MGVGDGVSVGVEVDVGVRLAVAVGVAVFVAVGVRLGVDVGPTGVLVAKSKTVGLGVFVPGSVTCTTFTRLKATPGMPTRTKIANRVVNRIPNIRRIIIHNLMQSDLKHGGGVYVPDSSLHRAISYLPTCDV